MLLIPVPEKCGSFRRSQLRHLAIRKGRCAMSGYRRIVQMCRSATSCAESSGPIPFHAVYLCAADHVQLHVVDEASSASCAFYQRQGTEEKNVRICAVRKEWHETAIAADTWVLKVKWDCECRAVCAKRWRFASAEKIGRQTGDRDSREEQAGWCCVKMFIEKHFKCGLGHKRGHRAGFLLRHLSKRARNPSLIPVLQRARSSLSVYIPFFVTAVRYRSESIAGQNFCPRTTLGATFLITYPWSVRHLLDVWTCARRSEVDVHELCPCPMSNGHN